MISPKIRIDSRKLKAAFDRFSRADKKAIMEKVVRTDAMGFVRDIVAITPPGNSGAPLASGARGEKAVQIGETKIASDLKKIFGPLPDNIMATAVANDNGASQNVRLWVGKNRKPYGVERSLFRPDATDAIMAERHAQFFLRGAMTAGRAKDKEQNGWTLMTRMAVTESAFAEYLKKVQSKIGILAGAWAAAAKKLKVRMPRIAKRHASGDCDFLEGSDSFRVRMENTVPYASDADLKRRAEWVLDSRKRANRLKKRIKVEIEAKMKAQLKKV